MIKDVKIRREAKITLFSFKDYFQGFEKLDAVKEIFGEETEKVINNLKVEFFSGWRGYMGTSPDDGHILVYARYLKKGDQRHIYLDIIHELAHVRQHMDGKELFDERYEYVDRPTEISAYATCVKEARRIGLSDREIFDYLKTEWMTEKDHARLAARLGVGRRSPTKRGTSSR